MKKLLGIVVLGLLLGYNANADENFENSFLEFLDSIDKNYMVGAIKYPVFKKKNLMKDCLLPKIQCLI